MTKADCFHLGYVAKLHGYKGEVSLFLDVTNPEDYHKLKMVFVELNEQLTPFFIQGTKNKNKGYLTVKFEGVDSEEAALKIVRKKIYLPEEILPELGEQNFYDHEVIGFKVIDKNYGDVGIIEQVVDLKTNPLLQIMNGDKEVLLPLIEGLILNVDRKNKTIEVQAPDGLISLYLD